MIISKKTINESLIQDETYTINQALFNINDGDELVLDEKHFKFRGEFAHEEFCFISNNDFGLKSIVFPVMNKKNIIIDGNGADLDFVGQIMPFYLYNCENITLKNFSIDYPRPFFTQAEIMEADNKSATLKIDKKKFPYIIENNLIKFLGEDYEQSFVFGLLEFSKEEMRPAIDAFDVKVQSDMVAEEVDDGIVKIYFPFVNALRPGNLLSIKLDKRFVPAIAINSCKNIKLENIHIKQAGTMGVVAQFTENISLNNVRVCPGENSGRIVSVNADATHFIACTGTVLVENCRFTNQLDDSINVHGNYLSIHKVISKNHVIAQIPHKQQVGVTGLADGTEIAICDGNSMITKGSAKIKKYMPINKKYFDITFEEDFDFEDGKIYCIDNKDFYPNVIFRNNYSGKNRARSLLLTSPKNILVENNMIESEGAIIKISSDMTGWYESGETTNVIIKNNKLSRRNCVRWGKALFDIDPEMDVHEDGEYFHKKIIIENNEIKLNKLPFAYGQSVENLIIENNKFIVDEYTKDVNDENLSSKVNIKDCKNLQISGNQFV